ncbi:hypothetical protein EDD52_102459 [Primorskyibacter sedentarius]|uniref:Uncharacterized protein n=1 Tax=Primorskyibacter sedentarius TaxID=745311 RepID=A0A4R3JN23_9RHOB|nr:hypothetical protein [Primorskyibacter sedentarius]TCS66641.1 hypothetical protein EDD52_102459 [Primorskyibacter sedentarius]
MIDLREIGEVCVWPDYLKPEGYGDFNVEDFNNWWERNGEKLNHLPEALAEQWIYRHWCESVASFLLIEDLTCREDTWPPDDFITKVGTVRGKEALNPKHDFEVFSGQETGEKLPTARALDSGQWDFPLVVLETPDGFIDCIGDHIETEYFLVEGHKRRRYLNALLHRGVSLAHQRVYVLSSTSQF